MDTRNQFSSNAIRLNKNEILFLVVLTIAVLFVLLPFTWRGLEKVKIGKNFRLAYHLRDDYWIYSALIKETKGKYSTLFLGDSVIWGMYVDNKNTLPAYLNKLLKKETIGNIAIDGLHSAAMMGLIEYYACDLKAKKILIHYNPLWMNSKKYDLQGDEKIKIHHPRLIPQFIPYIKSYHENIFSRIGIVAERYISFLNFLHHFRLLYWNNMSFSSWAIEHPYENFLEKVSFNLDISEHKKHNDSRSWEKRGLMVQDWKWLSPHNSFQWHCFLDVLHILQKRGNKIFVVVGPINPYILTPESLKKYREVLNQIETVLEKKNINFIILKDIPSEYYADASHPVAEGYKFIAKEFMKNKQFIKWITE